MIHSITVLTSSAGMRHHLPNFFLDEANFESCDRFLSSPVPDTLEDSLTEAEWFAHLILDADGISARGLETFASERWDQRWTRARSFDELERASGTWSEALEEAVNAHSHLAVSFDNLIWRCSDRALWAQHQRLRPELIAAGIDPTARLSLPRLIQSGCLGPGELPGLIMEDCYSPYDCLDGVWLDFRCGPDDKNLILFEASGKDYR